MHSLFPQHYVALAVHAGLSARAAIILVFFGLTENNLQFTELARDQPLRTLRALVNSNMILLNLQTTLACNLSVLQLFVLLEVRPGHWLLAYVTQCDVSSAVDLMGRKISLWNVMFAIATELCIFICHDLTAASGKGFTVSY